MKISIQTFLITMSLVFGIIIVQKSLQLIFSSSVLIKSLNVVMIIILSGCIGAFIRTLLLPKEK
ncbi:high-affinity K+ transport system ATPase subunit B [Paenibacillus sp. PastH-3]|nr:high-affinity K+ transport system ATPase subunit B [Paenibacillus sp. PastH-4]MDH6442787.1 high-affinity K+ transport system ATPase subunit B [Paenibacillus sp. PastF-4]MDH6526503.1 high-affinity K+ transport system ATPase subunit B [Paenibacillus sp. PastH-3]OMD60815.1 hypothetical protein BSK55_05510 [Paenibacillus odorifer]